MRNLKRLLRWFIHKISITLLANAVAIAIPLFALGLHVTNPGVVKNWLVRTNTYQTLINESLDLIQLDSSNTDSGGTLGDTLTENPFINANVIKDALRTTLTPEFVQEQAENFIDGTFAWLDDSSQVIPDFTFSFATKNQELAAKLSSSMKTEFNKLPICLPEEITPSFNLLDSLCLPEGIDIDAEVEVVVKKLAGDQGLLSNLTWTGEDMIKLSENESGLSQSQVDFAKTAFSGLKVGPLYLILAGVLAIPIVFFTSKSKYRGYNEVGNTLFSGSLFTFIPAMIIAHWQNLITNLIGNTGNSDSAVTAVRAIIEPFLQAAVGDIATLTAWISGGILLLSGVVVTNGIYVKRRYREQEEDKITAEIAESRESRRIKEIKKRAKRRAHFTGKTLDPVSEKPLKISRKSISKAEAIRIAKDPKNKEKTIAELIKKQK